MSLDYKFDDIENYKEVCLRPDSDEINGLATMWIFATMTIGIGQWTKKNINKVYHRIKMWERISGPLFGGSNPPEVTMEMVRPFIGLWTNATFKEETDAEFLKKMWRMHIERVNREDKIL